MFPNLLLLPLSSVRLLDLIRPEGSSPQSSFGFESFNKGRFTLSPSLGIEWKKAGESPLWKAGLRTLGPIIPRIFSIGAYMGLGGTVGLGGTTVKRDDQDITGGPLSNPANIDPVWSTQSLLEGLREYCQNHLPQCLGGY